MVKMPHWPFYLGPDFDLSNGLKRTKRVLECFNNPQKELKNVFHITGTKGKGSVCMYLTNIFINAGYSVNTYISPHIYEANERILYNNQKISDKDLYYYTEMIRIKCEKEGINYINCFEAITLTAILYFKDKKADINIIEVGCGGLNDPTNIFSSEQLRAVIINSIHKDHENILGEGIANIAIQKAALIKQDLENLIIGHQSEGVKNIINFFIQKYNVKNHYFYEDDFEISKIENIDDKLLFEDYKNQKQAIIPVPALKGEYQFKNFAIAMIAALKSNIDIQFDSIVKAALNTKHIVRMEEVTNNQLLEKINPKSRFFMDGAHNELAAVAIINFIRDFKNYNPEFVVYIIISRSINFNNEDMLKHFKHQDIFKVIATKANLEALPEPPEKIYKTGKELNLNIDFAQDIEKAFDLIDKNHQALIIACGSLYIARDIALYRK